MNSNQLVQLLPERTKNFAYLVLENARNQLHAYAQAAEVSLTSDETELVLLSVFADFLHGTFVGSKERFDSAFRFLQERNIGGFVRGSASLSPSDEFVSSWAGLVRDWRHLRARLDDFGLPPPGPVEEKVRWVLQSRDR